MKKLIIPITVLLVLGLFISLFFVLGNKPAKSYDTKTSQSEATIDITPKTIENSKAIAKSYSWSESAKRYLQLLA